MYRNTLNFNANSRFHTVITKEPIPWRPQQWRPSRWWFVAVMV